VLSLFLFRQATVRVRAFSFSLCLFVIPAGLAQQTINVPADAPTIQAAINEASNGDTVLVAPGTYKENINFNGKAITVKGAGADSATILDGQAQAAVVTFDSGEGRNSVLSNLTIQNGAATNTPADYPIVGAGGIYVNGAAPTIEENVIQNNFSCGIGIFDGAPLIEGNTINGTAFKAFEACGAQSGLSYDYPADGVAIFQAGYASDGQQTEIIGNTIENNTGGGPGELGASYTISPSGIYLVDGGTTLIEDNIIAHNWSDSSPGIEVYGDSVPAIIQNLIYGNIENQNNVIAPLSDFGAGMSIGPQLNVFKNAQLLIVNNTVVGNQEVYLPGLPGASTGGTQVAVSENAGQIEFANNIIIGPSGNGSHSAIQFFPGPDRTIHIPKFDHNDVFVAAGVPPYTCSSGTAVACDQQTGMNGNISTDPLFASSSSTGQYLYQLQLQSPAVDSGDNNAPDIPAEDILGQPRIQNAKGLATAVIDMGVYEYPGVALPPPAANFTLAAIPMTFSLAPGQQGTVTVTLTPTNSFQGTVSLSCGTLPAGISCSFQPQQITLNNGLIETALLTLGANATQQTNDNDSVSGMGRGPTTRLAGFLLPGGIVCILLVHSRRLRAQQMLIVLALLSCTAGISACGVTFNGYPENYTVSIYGTATGNIVRQASLQLTVLK
jgi:hypothetical protein